MFFYPATTSDMQTKPVAFAEQISLVRQGSIANLIAPDNGFATPILAGLILPRLKGSSPPFPSAKHSIIPRPMHFFAPHAV